MIRSSFAGVVLIAALCAAATTSAGRMQDPSVTAVLDRYGAGHRQDAVKAAASIPNLTRFTARYPIEAAAWIGTGPDAVRRRRAAAAFVLELTRARLESDWRLLRDLVEWTCADLRAADAPDAFERAWHLASLALAGRARERTWLLGEVPSLPGAKPRRQPRTEFAPKHLLHAAERFEADPAFRLEWIVAWTWGADREPTRGVDRALLEVPGRRGRRLDAIAALQPLTPDPSIGAEATLHIAQLQFVLGDFTAARNATAAAASRAKAPEVTYVAHVIGARALEALGRRDEARTEYSRALAVLPGGEAASIALAALTAADGDGAAPAADAAPAVVRMSTGSHDADPWRLFPYGGFRFWPERLRALQAEADR